MRYTRRVTTGLDWPEFRRAYASLRDASSRWNSAEGPRFSVREVSTAQRSVIKRTYQPKKRYRRRVHGFLRRMDSPGGRRVIQNRRRKGRQQLTPG